VCFVDILAYINRTPFTDNSTLAKYEMLPLIADIMRMQECIHCIKHFSNVLCIKLTTLNLNKFKSGTLAFYMVALSVPIAFRCTPFLVK
jgi:hypothetical protein